VASEAVSVVAAGSYEKAQDAVSVEMKRDVITYLGYLSFRGHLAYGQRTKKYQMVRNLTGAGAASSVLEVSAPGAEGSVAGVGSEGLASSGAVGGTTASVVDITKTEISGNYKERPVRKMNERMMI
jgi:hypothetical protein